MPVDDHRGHTLQRLRMEEVEQVCMCLMEKAEKMNSNIEILHGYA